MSSSRSCHGEQLLLIVTRLDIPVKRLTLGLTSKLTQVMESKTNGNTRLRHNA